MNLLNFFAELKRRNVYKVAVAYAVVGWLVIQISATVLPTFHAPEWIVQTLILLVAIGLPIALVLAWAFELTPEGIKRAEDVRPNDSLTPGTRRRFVLIVVLLAAAAAGLLVFQFLQTHPGRDDKEHTGGGSLALSDKSIAVLPFDNLSRDPDNAFFAEGVQDEILTRLAKVADLKVISRTSTQRFKSAPSDLREIAKQLGVMNILEGSVQKSNDQVRVNVQLINAMTDAHLWADIYDRKLTDMFSVESDIAKTVADTLQAKLTGREMSAIASRPTEDPVAHELFVKGRYFLGLRRGDNLPHAIELFRQVIARDPHYAAAYAGLSEAYILLPRYTAGDPKETRPQAKAAALKAFELDPNLAETHNVLGKIAYDHELDFEKSFREFRRAIELNPNYAGAHHWFSGALEGLGLFDQAITESKRGTELDPLSAVNLADQGRLFVSARRFPEAKIAFEKALELDPDFSYTHWHYGEMLQASGDLKRAGEEYAKARSENEAPETVALTGQLGAKMGRPEEARQALAALEQQSKHRPVGNYWRAILHLSLGDRDQAVRWLEQAYVERDGYEIGIIKVDPMVDSLRGDPRFKALAQKVIGPKTATAK
ncbi:MAG: adenylate cyclase [Verrucomicrobiota bacterium]|jgi:TolB-like protein/tetratricopeptide (TPR) repeat protein